MVTYITPCFDYFCSLQFCEIGVSICGVMYMKKVYLWEKCTLMEEMYPYGRNVHLCEKGTLMEGMYTYVRNVHLCEKGTLM